MIDDVATKLLLNAGPGHMVITRRWRDDSGAEITQHGLFVDGTLPEDVDSYFASYGWRPEPTWGERAGEWFRKLMGH